jgi:cysteine desulfurase/selenocysteine lyase
MVRNGTPQGWRRLFSVEQQVPRLDGTLGRYINFDNAASTPPFNAVQAAVREFMGWYSSVHRGSGFKSQLATRAYEQARQIILRFVGGRPEEHVCILGKNTTDALNKVAHRLPLRPGRDVVLVSLMEHHSNDLPYRARGKVVHVGVGPRGELDEADFDRQLKAYGDRVGLVAVTGASNVTGTITPARQLAEKAHAAGAHILVDCAQLAPHRAIDMGALDDPEHFDYVVFAGHKLYAPYGTGVLVGRRDTFEHGEPDQHGGGTVSFVSAEDSELAAPPDREEAGSPNVAGAVALAAAVRQLQAVGMQAVAAHEAELTRAALEAMNGIPGVEVLGDPDPARAGERLGVIPFQVKGAPHILTAAVLSYEHGIGVRNGLFCAHPFIMHLLGMSAAEVEGVRAQVRARDRRHMPGLVRASFGLYNTLDEVAAFAAALGEVARGRWAGRYRQDRASGDWVPEGWEPRFERFFSLLDEPLRAGPEPAEERG